MKKPAVSVLMVEDLHLAQIVAIRIFETLECKMHVVSSAAKALEQILMFHYDIIFIDIQLPDINGLTLVQTMRSLERKGTRIPIVAVTAYNRQHLDNDSQKAGFDDLLLKPLTVDKIKRALKHHLPIKKIHLPKRSRILA